MTDTPRDGTPSQGELSPLEEQSANRGAIDPEAQRAATTVRDDDPEADSFGDHLERARRLVALELDLAETRRRLAEDSLKITEAQLELAERELEEMRAENERLRREIAELRRARGLP
jgi:hypothetical protein